PQALALAWQVFDSDISPEDKRATLLYFDRVFGLQLERNEEIIIPVQVQALADQRLALKQQGRYQEADKLRDEIVELGYQVNDVGNHSTTLQRR
ncbi:cysteine--tRNA ligase, partial [Vibrio parahaemolyticus]|nr:cysteine--tRNA ligase [Vibrio parahaemolyticus]